MRYVLKRKILSVLFVLLFLASIAVAAVLVYKP